MQQDGLERSLKNRHIQMIALGGIIGTGLFYGSSEAINIAGPAVILAYLIAGFIIYLIMRMLGEMATEEPVAGAFSYFAYRYWGGFAGFFSGWNYWFLYILVSMTELTVVGIYVNYWISVDSWIVSLIVLVLMTTVNLIHVKLFGEFEYWFSLIKVLAICGMIVFGLILIVTPLGVENVSISNLWAYGGFFPSGLTGTLMALVVVMFSFGGTELVGITAGEAHDPQKSIPRAIYQVILRILLFYVGAITIILILTPWIDIGKMGSPFVMIFNHIGIPFAAHILNVIVLTAAVSVYNSGLYSNGRMLYSLAQQKNAPAFFAKLNKRHVPYNAVLFSSGCTLGAVIINYLVPNGAFMKVMAGATAAAILTWFMIVLVHLFFRHHHIRQKTQLRFPAPFAPYTNYLCIAFLSMILILMLATGLTQSGLLTISFQYFGLLAPNQYWLNMPIPDMSLSVLIIPLWILLLFIGYQIRAQR